MHVDQCHAECVAVSRRLKANELVTDVLWMEETTKRMMKMCETKNIKSILENLLYASIVYIFALTTPGCIFLIKTGCIFLIKT